MNSLPSDKKGRRLAYLFMVCTPLIIGFISLTLGQDANWDFRNYHWYNAYAWLTDRYEIDLLPSQKPSFYNPLMDAPFFLLAQMVSARVSFFVLSIVQGVNACLLFMIAYNVLTIPKKRQKIFICAALALLGMFGGGGIGLLGTTFYDNVTSIGILLSLLFTLHFWKQLQASNLFIALLIGLPMGLVVGLKLVTVPFAVGLCCAFLFFTTSFKRNFMLSFACGMGILLGGSLTLGPWAWHLWDQYQNPIFPHFNQLFNSALAPPTDSCDFKFLPQDIWEHLLFPFVFAFDPLSVGEVIWQDFRIPFLYALAPVALLTRLAFGTNDDAPDRFSEMAPTRFLLWFTAGAYLVWLFLFGIYRYLIPIEMIAPLLIVALIGMLPLTVSRRIVLCIVSLLLITGSIQAANWGRHPDWLDTPAPVDAPPLQKTNNLMVLMTTYEPYSHVIPSFPPEISFVRIQSNFTTPESNIGFNELIRKKVIAHKGDFKALIPNWSLDWSAQTLKALNLHLLQNKCVSVKDHLYNSTLVLCDVKK